MSQYRDLKNALETAAPWYVDLSFAFSNLFPVVRFCIARQATLRGDTTYATTKHACAFTIPMHVGIASKMVITVHSPTASTISGRQCTTSKSWRPCKRPKLAVNPWTDPMYWTRNAIWWMKIQSGKTQTMSWPTTRQSLVKGPRGSADRATHVHSTTTVRTKDAVPENISTGNLNLNKHNKFREFNNLLRHIVDLHHALA